MLYPHVSLSVTLADLSPGGMVYYKSLGWIL